MRARRRRAKALKFVVSDSRSRSKPSITASWKGRRVSGLDWRRESEGVPVEGAIDVPVEMRVETVVKVDTDAAADAATRFCGESVVVMTSVTRVVWKVVNTGPGTVTVSIIVRSGVVEGVIVERVGSVGEVDEVVGEVDEVVGEVDEVDEVDSGQGEVVGEGDAVVVFVLSLQGMRALVLVVRLVMSVRVKGGLNVLVLIELSGMGVVVVPSLVTGISAIEEVAVVEDVTVELILVEVLVELVTATLDKVELVTRLEEVESVVEMEDVKPVVERALVKSELVDKTLVDRELVEIADVENRVLELKTVELETNKLEVEEFVPGKPLFTGPKVLQTSSAAASAAASLEKPPSVYVAPPIDSKIVFPKLWQVLISSPMSGQSSSPVPGNNVQPFPELAKLITGSSPGPDVTCTRKAMGMMSTSEFRQ